METYFAGRRGCDAHLWVLVRGSPSKDRKGSEVLVTGERSVDEILVFFMWLFKDENVVIRGKATYSI